MAPSEDRLSKKATKFTRVFVKRLKEGEWVGKRKNLKNIFQHAVNQLPEAGLKTILQSDFSNYLATVQENVLGTQSTDVPTKAKSNADANKEKKRAKKKKLVENVEPTLAKKRKIVVTQEPEEFPYNLYLNKGKLAQGTLSKKKYNAAARCLIGQTITTLNPKKLDKLLKTIVSDSDDWACSTHALCDVITGTQNPAALRQAMLQLNRTLVKQGDAILHLKASKLKSAQEALKGFLMFFHYKWSSLTEEFTNPPYADLMAALLSVYADIVVTLSRTSEADNKDALIQGLLMTSSQLVCPEYLYDVILQQAGVEPGDEEALLPFWRYALLTPHNVTVCSGYTKYMCALRDVLSRLEGQAKDGFLTVAMTVAPPTGYLSWLQDLDPEVLSETPLTATSSESAVTRYLVEEADDDIMEVLLNLLTIDESLLEEQVPSNAVSAESGSGTDANATPLFFFDKTATVTDEIPNNEQQEDVSADIAECKFVDIDDDQASLGESECEDAKAASSNDEVSGQEDEETKEDEEEEDQQQESDEVETKNREKEKEVEEEEQQQVETENKEEEQEDEEEEKQQESDEVETKNREKEQEEEQEEEEQQQVETENKEEEQEEEEQEEEEEEQEEEEEEQEEEEEELQVEEEQQQESDEVETENKEVAQEEEEEEQQVEEELQVEEEEEQQGSEEETENKEEGQEQEQEEKEQQEGDKVETKYKEIGERDHVKSGQDNEVINIDDEESGNSEEESCIKIIQSMKTTKVIELESESDNEPEAFVEDKLVVVIESADENAVSKCMDRTEGEVVILRQKPRSPNKMPQRLPGLHSRGSSISNRIILDDDSESSLINELSPEANKRNSPILKEVPKAGPVEVVVDSSSEIESEDGFVIETRLSKLKQAKLEMSPACRTRSHGESVVSFTQALSSTNTSSPKPQPQSLSMKQKVILAKPETPRRQLASPKASPKSRKSASPSASKSPSHALPMNNESPMKASQKANQGDESPMMVSQKVNESSPIKVSQKVNESPMKASPRTPSLNVNASPLKASSKVRESLNKAQKANQGNESPMKVSQKVNESPIKVPQKVNESPMKASPRTPSLNVNASPLKASSKVRESLNKAQKANQGNESPMKVSQKVNESPIKVPQKVNESPMKASPRTPSLNVNASPLKASSKVRESLNKAQKANQGNESPMKVSQKVNESPIKVPQKVNESPMKASPRTPSLNVNASPLKASSKVRESLNKAQKANQGNESPMKVSQKVNESPIKVPQKVNESPMKASPRTPSLNVSSKVRESLNKASPMVRDSPMEASPKANKSPMKTPQKTNVSPMKDSPKGRESPREASPKVKESPLKASATVGESPRKASLKVMESQKKPSAQVGESPMKTSHKASPKASKLPLLATPAATETPSKTSPRADLSQWASPKENTLSETPTSPKSKSLSKHSGSCVKEASVKAVIEEDGSMISTPSPSPEKIYSPIRHTTVKAVSPETLETPSKRKTRKSLGRLGANMLIEDSDEDLHSHQLGMTRKALQETHEITPKGSTKTMKTKLVGITRLEKTVCDSSSDVETTASLRIHNQASALETETKIKKTRAAQIVDEETGPQRRSRRLSISSVTSEMSESDIEARASPRTPAGKQKTPRRIATPFATKSTKRRSLAPMLTEVGEGTPLSKVSPRRQLSAEKKKPLTRRRSTLLTQLSHDLVRSPSGRKSTK